MFLAAPQSMWDFASQPGIEPVHLAVKHRVLTTASSPRKSLPLQLLMECPLSETSFTVKCSVLSWEVMCMAGGLKLREMFLQASSIPKTVSHHWS